VLLGPQIFCPPKTSFLLRYARSSWSSAGGLRGSRVSKSFLFVSTSC